MALTDRDPNVSNRDSLSRASNLSSKTPAGQNGHLASRNASATDTLSSAAGVLSMLRTATELGDVGNLPLRRNRPPKTNHGPPRRPNNTMPPSRTSSHYSRTGSRAGSIHSKASSSHSMGDQNIPGQWPYHHYHHASSLDLPLDARTHHSSNSVASTSDRLDLEQRSYSLTNTLPPQRRPSNHASLQNLRNPTQMSARPRSPYRYPARLRRPGVRPASPALSDTFVPQSNRIMPSRPGYGPRAITTSPLQHHRTPAVGPSNYQAFRNVPQPWLNSKQTDAGDAHHWPLRPSLKQADFVGPFELPNNQIGPASHSASNSSPPYGRTASSFRANPSPSGNDDSPTAASGRRSLRGPLADTAPYVGFVKRVKQVLEERASIDDVRPPINRTHRPKKGQTETGISGATELDASPEVKRLTREMIKAAMGPPSDTGAMSPEAPASVISLAQADESSASSMVAKYSLDYVRSSSTPEIPNSASSFAQTTPSSMHRQNVDKTSISTPYAIAVIAFDPQSAMPENQDLESDNTANLEVEDAVRPMAGHRCVPFSETSSMQMALERPMSLPPQRRQVSSRAEVERHSMPASAEFEDQKRLVEHRINLVDDKASVSSLETIDVSEAIHPTVPASARSSLQSASRPESTTDTPTWASSSIMARMSFNPECSRPSSVSSTMDTQHMARSVVAGPSTSNLSVLRESMASIENNSAFAPSPLVIDPKLSAMKQFQFPLPDLTEDSQEDASTTNLRMLGSRPPAFRSGGPKKKREYRGPARHDPMPAGLHAPSSYLSRKLSNTKNMPSLNFSHTDLTTKLNMALGIRSSPLREEVVRPDSVISTRPTSSKRPESTVMIRERYRSFFSEADEVIEDETISSEQPIVERVLIPDDLLSEIDRLSIPSVNGLTVRLSELLPTIKKGKSFLDLTSSDEAFNSTVDEIRELGSEEKMASLDRKRASLISALTAGTVAQSRRSGNSTVRDKIAVDPQKPGVMKDLPLLPTECKDPRPSISSEATVGLMESSNPNTTDKLPGLEATVVIESPRESRNIAESIQSHQPKINHKKKHSSRQSNTLVGRTSESRPHPDDTLNISLGEAPTITEVKATRPEYRLTRSRSMMDLPQGDPERIARSMSPGPHMETSLVPQIDDTMEIQKQKQRKRGIIGSLQRKIGLKQIRTEKAGFPVDPEFFHPGERIVSVQGDRYPTTALTPPSNMNMDETRSFFSDDSSLEEEVRTNPLKKRLTRLRYRYSTNSGQPRASSRAMSAPDSHIDIHSHAPWLDQDASNSSDSNGESTHPDIALVYDQPPSGMTKLEFRAKRMIEKFRIFWSRSGQYIRSMSRAKKQTPSWYAESDMYDGT